MLQIQELTKSIGYSSNKTLTKNILPCTIIESNYGTAILGPPRCGKSCLLKVLRHCTGNIWEDKYPTVLVIEPTKHDQI